MPLRGRRSIRLPDYDYRQPGWYFVTVCTADRACVFGEVRGGTVRMSPLGRMAEAQWRATWTLRPYLVPDAYVVMPNHVHLVFGLMPTDTAISNRGGTITMRGDTAPGDITRRDTLHGVPTPDRHSDGHSERAFGHHAARFVSSIVGAYKAAVTRFARRDGLWGVQPLWQGRFHDRIVRDEAELSLIRRYVVENPIRWHLDRYAP